MKVKIQPSELKGSILVPPSKSAAHRVLISAGLANGVSRISNVDLSKDIQATLACLKSYGADYQFENGTVVMKGAAGVNQTVRTGSAIKIDSKIKTDGSGTEEAYDVFPCNECGSTLRFFVPICLTKDKEVILTGTPKLMSRPLEIYEKICKEQGLLYELSTDSLKVRGPLSAGNYQVKGNISSQFISGLLFALAGLAEESSITVENPYESKPYVEMTIQALEWYGISIQTEMNDAGETVYRIPAGQRYQPCDTTVEGDWSNAAFFYALQMMGQKIEILGTDTESTQGDKVCIEDFQKISEASRVSSNGANATDSVDAVNGADETIDVSDCPDLAPILFAYAGYVCAQAKTDGGNHSIHFTGTRRLAFKESDRVKAMAEELESFGIRLTAAENDVVITAGDFHAPNRELSGHNDHRVVMALAVLCTKTGGTIAGAEAVSKSFPDFFERLEELGAIVVRETT